MARQVYEEALEFLGESIDDENFFVEWAAFEERVKEYERVRAIMKFGLNAFQDNAPLLQKAWVAFEKKHGDRDSIDMVLFKKRKLQYEEVLAQNALNYDTWFDYLQLLETFGDIDTVREAYETAISNTPPAMEKRLWKRYIYLWINYACFEELDAQDMERTRQVFDAAVRLIPHKSFSFTKIWTLYANFEIRQQQLDNVRKVFGNAIGVYPHPKIFQAYIDFELQLANVDRCRKIYERWLDWTPSNCTALIKFAEFESSLQEIERTRAIFEMAVDLPLLDNPEALWKAFIDFETEQEEFERVRNLYARLLERTQHVRVWVSQALFEGTSIGDIPGARKIFEKANDFLKSHDKEERVLLLEAWLSFEQEQPENSENIQKVADMMPRKETRLRPIFTSDGTEVGQEEYYEYIFPGEEASQNKLKILEKAKLWKKLKAEQNSDSNNNDDHDDDDN